MRVRGGRRATIQEHLAIARVSIQSTRHSIYETRKEEKLALLARPMRAHGNSEKKLGGGGATTYVSLSLHR